MKLPVLTVIEICLMKGISLAVQFHWGHKIVVVMATHNYSELQSSMTTNRGIIYDYQ